MPKLIKVHNETYDSLSGIRSDKETFDEAITRLLRLYSSLQKVIKADQDILREDKVIK